MKGLFDLASDRIGNINALGAEALGEAWNSVVTWAKSDKGQKVLMTIGSVAEIAGGIALTVGIAGSGAGIAILGGVLLGGGVSSLAGGWVSEKIGDSFISGWVGGQISGALTGAGLAAGPQLELSFIWSELLATTGGTAGGAFGNAISQKIENGEVNWSVVEKSGMINGTVSAFAGVFNKVPLTLLADASTGIIGKIVGSGITLINEIIADLSSTIMST